MESTPPVISNNLLKGTIKILRDNKIKYDVRIVDGCFEIPQLVNILLKRKKHSFCVVLGCIIKGQTPHFDLICSSTFNTIMDLSVTFCKPIGNGIITALNLKQAYQRSKIKISKKPNKGVEAANAVISILNNEPKNI